MSELPQETAECLVEAAKAARKNAYAPYSHFAVGAALLACDGRIFTGCNLENAAFTPGICAERTAVAKAVSEGVRTFRALAVAGGPAGGPTGAPPTPPCGVCRQVLREFCSDAFPVLLACGGNGWQETTLGALLPQSFGPEQLV